MLFCSSPIRWNLQFEQSVWHLYNEVLCILLLYYSITLVLLRFLYFILSNIKNRLGATEKPTYSFRKCFKLNIVLFDDDLSRCEAAAWSKMEHIDVDDIYLFNNSKVIRKQKRLQGIPFLFHSHPKCELKGFTFSCTEP